MTARWRRRLARTALLTTGVLLLATAAAAPASADETRPAPVVRNGGIVRVDRDPGGPIPAGPSPQTLNLFKQDAFRYQDPNYAACTATSALVMLNTIARNQNGGPGFRWVPRLGLATLESILAWERTHDTLEGGSGSDPHGWRNALNYYGWGSGALDASHRIYDDYAYTSYARAVKTAVRQLIRTRKPVGILAWGGRHAQLLTGYDGLKGDPFARTETGSWANAFTVDAVYLSDPLKSDGWVNARIPYATLASTTNRKLRFVPYTETDSPYDDPYTLGVVPARNEWYGHWIILAANR